MNWRRPDRGHQTELVAQADDGLEPRFAMRCSCGWESLPYFFFALALEAGEGHVNELEMERRRK